MTRIYATLGYTEPISLFLQKYTKKEPRNLLDTFPKAARLNDINDYPMAVSLKLKELGINNDDLKWKSPSTQYQYNKNLSDKLIPIGIVTLLVFLFLCIIAGFFQLEAGSLII
ncbi:hypothetical protein D1BOALGB6SA_1937 [Olavius sp. associated proteobacterium Delta 1]|nr:hypothetical protein D1BOALGB6SA_1937 [Olavius sp. associated proteobacterium Delta 1]